MSEIMILKKILEPVKSGKITFDNRKIRWFYRKVANKELPVKTATRVLKFLSMHKNEKISLGDDWVIHVEDANRREKKSTFVVLSIESRPSSREEIIEY